MVLKLTIYVRNVISFFYKPKKLVKFRYLFSFRFFSPKISILACFTGTTMFMTSLWRHTLEVCTYVSVYGKRRHITILWYQNNSYLGGSVFMFGGGVVTTALLNRVTEKGLVRRGLWKSTSVTRKRRYCRSSCIPISTLPDHCCPRIPKLSAYNNSFRETPVSVTGLTVTIMTDIPPLVRIKHSHSSGIGAFISRSD